VAKRRRTSANRVIVDLQEKVVAFFELADRLVRATDQTEQKRLKEELARMTFGQP
jgi:hypothetical protein